MDVSTFFTRLLQPQKGAGVVRAPDDIADFDLAWRSVQETLRQPDERQLARGIRATGVPDRLKHLVDALIYEAGHTDEDTTGSCMEYLLKNDVLAGLERFSETDLPAGIRGQVLKTFNDLVVSLSERFLVHNAVHRPLRRLLRSCVGDEPTEKVDGAGRAYGAAGMDRAEGHMDPSTEEDLLDLMCTLASRLRAHPQLLLIFFHPGRLDPAAPAPAPARPSMTSIADSPTGHSPQQFDFLLFSYLLRYAHLEGKTGDLARAGLLFLLDIAFLTADEEGGESLLMPMPMSQGQEGRDPLQNVREALGAHILSGDFADVMAAGLGAIWSLLPSKLHVPTLAEVARADAKEDGTNASASGGMHLGATLDGGDEQEELQLSTDMVVRDQLDLLVKLLGFLQDIIRRYRSPLGSGLNDDQPSDIQALGASVAEATFGAIESSFINNVVYPSIMECSPSDGSSVAVLSYLEVIFSKLDDGPLLRMILEVLLDTRGELTGPKRSARTEYYADDGRFTLKDLIIENVRSNSAQSTAAALRLLNTILTCHCAHSVRGLLHTIRHPGVTTLHKRSLDDACLPSFLPSPATIVDAPKQEIELYGSLINHIDPLQTSLELAGGYSAYLVDVQRAIQADECFLSSQIPLQFSYGEGTDLVQVGQFDTDPFQHRLSPNDPILSLLFEMLGQFMTSTTEANVALTGVLTSLALCPNRSLAGWVTYELPKEVDPWSQGVNRSSNSDSDSDSADARRRPRASPGNDDPFTARKQVDLPALYQILRDLVRQVNRFRLDVDDFDRLLAERRQGLLFTDHLNEAMNVLLDVEPSVYGLQSTPTKVNTPALKKSKSGLMGGLKAFLTPTKKTPISRSGAASPITVPNSVSRPTHGSSIANSPFRSHYEQTTYFSLETHTATPISSGPWSPSKQTLTDPKVRPKSSPSQMDSASVFTANRDHHVADVNGGPKRVTLSSVLDNCVILEEFLKEVVAVITARRALGVDQVGFTSSLNSCVHRAGAPRRHGSPRVMVSSSLHATTP